jgi:hypothetical protein
LTKSKTSTDDHLRRLLAARLELRVQPWACAEPVDLTVERDSRDQRRLVIAAHEALRVLGAGRPPSVQRDPAALAGLAVVRQWLRFGLDPESRNEARTALVIAGRPCQAAVERWERICAELEARAIATPLLVRARRKLVRRRWELHHLRAAHQLVHLIRAPLYLYVRPFVEHLSRCAAAAEVLALLGDAAALRDLENLAWPRSARSVRTTSTAKHAAACRRSWRQPTGY